MKSEKETLSWLDADKLDTLKRNPQYLTPKQMDALKTSIDRDGFVVPILVRPLKGGRFEVISGNHRLMAAREIGRKRVPCVIVDLSTKAAQRLAVNLNLIHGDPPAELLAPFLAELDDDVLREIHLDGDLLADVKRFDSELAVTLASLERTPDALDNDSNPNIPDCICPTCKRRHVSFLADPKNIGAQRRS